MRPGEKSGDYYDETPLDGERVKLYRSATMRLGYVAQDVPLVQYSANKVAKLMSKPTVGGLNRLKRVARSLVAHPRWQTVYGEQEPMTR